MAVLVLARVRGTRAIYGVLLETVSSPGTVCGVVGPLADAASRRHFLAGDLPTDPTRAAWGQRQRWAFPSLALRLAPDVASTAGATTTAPHALPQTAVRHAIEVAVGDAGRLDVAVNSAGVDGGNDSHPLIDYPVETLDLMLATNVRGMFLSMKYELQVMATQGFGSIVNISSGAGLTGVPGYSGYVASKHAEIGLTKAAALDYADRNVRVNAVCPGLVNTPLIADMVSENPAMHEQLVASHPLGRIAEPEEVADAIMYLATSKSSYVTGIALPVDGGYLAR